jgi:hypothetical protein
VEPVPEPLVEPVRGPLVVPVRGPAGVTGAGRPQEPAWVAGLLPEEAVGR